VLKKRLSGCQSINVNHSPAVEHKFCWRNQSESIISVKIHRFKCNNAYYSARHSWTWKSSNFQCSQNFVSCTHTHTQYPGFWPYPKVGIPIPTMFHTHTHTHSKFHTRTRYNDWLIIWDKIHTICTKNSPSWKIMTLHQYCSPTMCRVMSKFAKILPKIFTLFVLSSTFVHGEVEIIAIHTEVAVQGPVRLKQYQYSTAFLKIR
jgi:hypothetical protein